MKHDPVLYGEIRGFLHAVALVNTESSAAGEYCDFSFAHVPAIGPLKESLTRYVLTKVQETAPNRVWRGKPVLETCDGWRPEVEQAANELLHMLFTPRPMLGQTAEADTPRRVLPHSLVETLDRFLSGEPPTVWRLTWRSPDGERSYPWSVAYPKDWVFDHEGEWFHLGLIYSD
jgi:hypothetical protein